MGHRSEFIGREGPKCSPPFVRPCNTLVVHSTPFPGLVRLACDAELSSRCQWSQGELGRCEGLERLVAMSAGAGTMSGSNRSTTRQSACGTAATKPKSPVTISGALPPNSIRRRKLVLQRIRRFGLANRATAMRLAVTLRSSGPPSLLGLGVDELRWLVLCAPGSSWIEGEVIELTSFRSRRARCA